MNWLEVDGFANILWPVIEKIIIYIFVKCSNNFASMPNLSRIWSYPWFLFCWKNISNKLILYYQSVDSIIGHLRSLAGMNKIAIFLVGRCHPIRTLKGKKEITKMDCWIGLNYICFLPIKFYVWEHCNSVLYKY